MAEGKSDADPDHNLAYSKEPSVLTSGDFARSLGQIDSFGEGLESSHDLTSGAVLSGRYEVIAVIGTGGMGVVYKVKQPYLRKFFALKTVRSLCLSEQAIARFRKEAKAAGALDHPGLVTVHDFGLLEDGQPFLVMDLIGNGSLFDAIKQQGPLPPERVLDIFEQACDALSYAHEHKIIHRDLKPGNILLDQDEEGRDLVRIADFGVAKILEDDSGASLRLTQTGDMLGSPLYMSPEQCSGKIADERSDIYSLSCSMFEALAGRPPFRGDSALATLLLHQKGPLPTLSEASGRRFSENLEDLFVRALDKEPDHRYQSMKELKEAVVTARSGSPVSSRPKIFRRKEKIKPATAEPTVPLHMVLISSTIIAILSCLATLTVIQSKSAPPLLELPKKKPMTVTHERLPKAIQKTTIVDGKRVFHFPDNYSMGVLYRLDKTGYIPIGNCIGNLTVSVKEPLKFRPNWAVCEIPDAFGVFGEDDLMYLDFSNLPCTDQVLEHITHLRGVRTINLQNTEITDRGLQYILGMPHLQDLTLSATSISAESIISLSRIKTLTDLTLNNVPIRKFAMAYFRNGTGITHLAIRNTGIDDSALDLIAGNMKNLTGLSISDNSHITADGLRHLVALPHLMSLHMANCKGVDPASAIAYLKLMPQLVDLHLEERERNKWQLAGLNSQLPKCTFTFEEAGRHRKVSID